MNKKERPILPDLINEATTEIESFQNKTLRPIIKMQHDLLILSFQNYLVKRKIDFLNIDIEGLDFVVLKTIDLKFFNPKLICIEILNKNDFKKVKNYFVKFNYFFIKRKTLSFFFEYRHKKN